MLSCIRKTLKSQQGGVLVLAMIAISMLSVLGLSAVGASTNDFQMTLAASDAKKALYVAEAGLAAGKSSVIQDLVTNAVDVTGDIEGLDSAGNRVVIGRYHVDIVTTTDLIEGRFSYTTVTSTGRLMRQASNGAWVEDTNNASRTVSIQVVNDNAFRQYATYSSESMYFGNVGQIQGSIYSGGSITWNNSNTLTGTARAVGIISDQRGTIPNAREIANSKVVSKPNFFTEEIKKEFFEMQGLADPDNPENRKWEPATNSQFVQKSDKLVGNFVLRQELNGNYTLYKDSAYESYEYTPGDSRTRQLRPPKDIPLPDGTNTVIKDITPEQLKNSVLYVEGNIRIAPYQEKNKKGNVTYTQQTRIGKTNDSNWNKKQAMTIFSTGSIAVEDNCEIYGRSALIAEKALYMRGPNIILGKSADGQSTTFISCDNIGGAFKHLNGNIVFYKERNTGSDIYNGDIDKHEMHLSGTMGRDGNAARILDREANTFNMTNKDNKNVWAGLAYTLARYREVVN